MADMDFFPLFHVTVFKVQVSWFLNSLATPCLTQLFIV